MDDIQAQMNSILQDPAMMQKIMAMAQSLNPQQGTAAPDEPKAETAATALPELDMSTLQRLSGLAGRSNIDSNQQSLLKALTPYLSRDRINKLERAMRAAKLASVASSIFGRAGGTSAAGR